MQRSYQPLKLRIRANKRHAPGYCSLLLFVDGQPHWSAPADDFADALRCGLDWLGSFGASQQIKDDCRNAFAQWQAKPSAKGFVFLAGEKKEFSRPKRMNKAEREGDRPDAGANTVLQL